jgi:hypothetical protein
MSLARPALALGLLAVLALSAGCSGWSKTPVPPETGELPDMVRAQLKDGRTVKLAHAGVVGDSLVGEVKTPSRRGHEPAGKDTIAVALKDIDRVEESHFKPWATLAVLVILGGIVLAVLGYDPTGTW